MFEFRANKAISRSTCATESEARTKAQAIAHRLNTSVTVHLIRKHDGRRIFVGKLHPAKR